MRRLLTLVFLLCLALPAGISISGCYRNPAGNYCNGLGYGLKTTAVASIDLEPRTIGISLAFGQTQQISGPQAKTCKGAPASVSSYSYGTSNNQLVDISPTGNICAGTWNRNTGGGIANYTICSAPNPVPNTGGLPYSTAFITASAATITSNPVEVYIHAAVTTISLVGPTQCVSQAVSENSPTQLDAQACYSAPVNGKPTNVLFCAPSSVTNPGSGNPIAPLCASPPSVSLSSIPACTNSIGTFGFNVGTPSVATINPENNQITAVQPGTTVITASLAGSGSSAGYFSTCPPESITVSLNGQTTGPVTVTQGVTQNLVTTVTDTNGLPITGLTLDYQSTNPLITTAGGTGSITTDFPGQASIYAICQPSTCNPAPINRVGLNATGLSIASNPMTVVTPGAASAYAWFAAPGKSRYIIPVELIAGTIGSTIRLPYVPNSMLMDQTGSDLYLGSSHELMIVGASSNSVTKTDTNVPGVVLAVAPNNSTLLINDQVRRILYIYGSNGNILGSFGGMGASAQWTPDSKTLYVADNASLGAGHSDTLYVYNVNTGWTTYPGLPSQPLPVNMAPVPRSLALMIPGVGAYLSGSSTVAHTWCPIGTVGDYNSMSFYPQGDDVNTLTDALAATVDGKHILGAAVSGGGITLSDIGIKLPAPKGVPDGAPVACPVSGNTLKPLIVNSTLNTAAIPANATAVNQVVAGERPQTATAAPESNLAFITYTGTTAGATLPYYVPGAPGTTGTVDFVPLTGSSAITAPLAGAFSPDNTLFFVSTAGDNKVHYIQLAPTGPPTDVKQISPNLPACTPVSAGGNDLGCIGPAPAPNTPVPATAIAVRPRSTT